MTKEMLHTFKWFWPWQDEQEEEWLSEMAAEGWHLESLSFPNRYQFQRDEPENVVYKLDYQTQMKKDRDSYLQLFADAGWDHVGDMGGWAYFRKQVKPGQALEIYSDIESKSKKYQRILFYLIGFLPIMMFILLMAGKRTTWPYLILQGVFFVLFLLYDYVMIRLIIRISQLKKEG